jgi:hypothetical protein
MTLKDKKPQWDGKSRVSNDLYRKNFKKIFGEEPPKDDSQDDLPDDPNNHEYE